MSGVTVRLTGGLGNQMFQYAAGRAVALRNNVPLDLDLSWFGTDPERQYALAPFRPEAVIKIPPTKRGRLRILSHRIGRIMRPFMGYGRHSVYHETSFSYDPSIENLKTPIIMDGYFQSERYFLHLRPIILKEFTLSSRASRQAEAMMLKIRGTDAICVHIRRGDYVTNALANAYHGTCSLEYYDKGVREVAKGLSNPHCFVFSDDPRWVQENFCPAVPMTLVDIHGPVEAHEDLRLMSACQNFVIANSSLSWWGAWLGECGRKKVVAPRKWFAKSDIDTSDLIPADWIRL